MVSFTLCDSQKKNLRAKPLFFQKSCAQKNENESIPLFWGSGATKKSGGRFRGIKFSQIGDKTFVLYSITNRVLSVTHRISIRNLNKIEVFPDKSSNTTRRG
jgi:hypothetical protein